MGITGTDSLGAYIDTGVGVAPTPRASVEEEIHAPGETDSGSKLTLTTLVASHQPHRSKTSPR